MKILVISNFYPPYYRGGYELSCQSVVDGLIQRGHQVLVVTSDWQGRNSSSGQNEAEPALQRSAGRGIIKNDVWRVLHFYSVLEITGLKRRILQFFRAARGVQDYLAVRSLVRDMQPDVAYLWNMSGLSLMPLKVFQQFRIPLVFHLEDYWLLQQWVDLKQESGRMKRLYRSVIQGGIQFEHLSLNHLISDSGTLRQRYIQEGFLPDTITVIPTGLPFEYIADEPSPLEQGQAINLLYVGRLLEIKGVHVAIEAMAYLVHEKQLDGVHLNIVGAGEAGYCERLSQMVISLRLEKHVSLLGDLPHQEVISRYRRHSILLFPSIWVEPFGRVVIEAMAQGLCVIASNRGGPAEHITHGENGLLVPAEDPIAMAQAIADLVADGALRDHIRNAAIATVRERYLLDKMRDRVEAYLQAAVDGNTA
jgi:glycosyltransferase involved in cell wall biosynthesis